MGVEPIGDRLGRRGQCPVADALERLHVRTQLVIEPTSVLDIETGRFAHHQGGPPLGENTGFERGQGVRHFMDKGFWQAHVPPAADRRVAAGQGDFGTDPRPRRAAGIPADASAARLALSKATVKRAWCGAALKYKLLEN